MAFLFPFTNRSISHSKLRHLAVYCLFIFFFCWWPRPPCNTRAPPLGARPHTLRTTGLETDWAVFCLKLEMFLAFLQEFIRFLWWMLCVSCCLVHIQLNAAFIIHSLSLALSRCLSLSLSLSCCLSLSLSVSLSLSLSLYLSLSCCLSLFLAVSLSLIFLKMSDSCSRVIHCRISEACKFTQYIENMSVCLSVCSSFMADEFINTCDSWLNCVKIQLYHHNSRFGTDVDVIFLFRSLRPLHYSWGVFLFMSVLIIYWLFTGLFDVWVRLNVTCAFRYYRDLVDFCYSRTDDDSNKK